MQDPRYRTLEEQVGGDVVIGVDLGREPSTSKVAVIAHHGPRRLGALLVGLTAALAATLPLHPPIVIMSRRHTDDDVLDGVVYNAPNVLANPARLGEALIIDDPWAAAEAAQAAGSLRNDLDRQLAALAAGYLPDPVLDWGAKRRPSRTGHGLRLAQRARLAEGACSYRPTGRKRTHRRAMGKAYEAMRRDFYRTLSNEGF